MDTIHKCSVVAHIRGERTKKVANTLLVLHIDIEVADKYNTPVGSDVLLAPTELAGLHVALEDVDAFLLIEGNA